MQRLYCCGSAGILLTPRFFRQGRSRAADREREASVGTLMHSSGTDEGSPLLSGASGPMRGWGDAGRAGSGRPLLGGESPDRRRRIGASSLRRNWRVSAGVAGVVMFAMALAGLVAIFNIIQAERTPRDSWTLEVKDAGAGGAAAAASKGRQRCESAASQRRC